MLFSRAASPSKFYSLSTRGFSIVELMVVILIMTILAGVALPALGRLRTSSLEVVAEQQRGAMTQGLEAWAGGLPIPSFAVATKEQRFAEWLNPGSLSGSINVYSIRDPKTGNVRAAANIGEARLAMLGYFMREISWDPDVEGGITVGANSITFSTLASSRIGKRFTATWSSASQPPVVTLD
jgi:prepilin-type N-terminal cleavage/methylation domain-containing protein